MTTTTEKTIEKLWNILGDESFYNEHHVQVSDADKDGEIVVIMDSWDTVKLVNSKLGCDVDALDGILMSFSDQSGLCSDCNCHVDTQPTHAWWTPPYCEAEIARGELVCLECCECETCVENANNEVILESQPDWIDGELTVDDIKAICQGGCASGAYMPAVTYYRAVETMGEHGDDVLQYLEDNSSEPSPPTGLSWSGMAVYYLSTAVEVWALGMADEIRLDY